MSEVKRMEIAPELVRRAQAGDEAAFNQLYEQTGTAIYRTIFSMVQNEETAWDVHQNTYLLAWRWLHKLEKPEAFLAWLRRIAVNEAVKTLKKEEPLRFSELADDEDEEPQFVDERDGCQPEIALDKRETARLVREILEKLPQRQRLVIGMYYYEGYSVKEIAERLDVSQNTVKVQLHQGRKRVEAEVRRLEGEGVKLHGMAPMAFLLFLLRNQDPGKLIGKRAAQAILTKTAATEPVVLTAKAVGSGFFHTALGKLTAFALSAAVVAGSVLGYHTLQKFYQSTGDYRPTETVASTEALPVALESNPASTTGPQETQTEPQTEPQTEAPEETQPQSPGAALSFPWSACAFDDSILAAICNGPFSDEEAPTVIWNEGTQDQLRIYPRYAGSTVSARRIGFSSTLWEEETPTYSAVCDAGDFIGAALERPELYDPIWVITVQTPDGREGRWILDRNEYGTPDWEFVSARCVKYVSKDDGLDGDFSEYYFEPRMLRETAYAQKYNYDLPYKLGIGESMGRSLQHAMEPFDFDYVHWLDRYYLNDESTVWNKIQNQMRGDTCSLDAAVEYEYYNSLYQRFANPLSSNYDEDLGYDYPGTVAESVAFQAQQFAKERLISAWGTIADEDVELHFDLHGLLVYNLTLSAKTVSITVNGEDAGAFSLTEGDFFTWIPLKYADLPGDRPVHVELRVVDTYFGTAEQSIIGLIPNLTSIFINGR